MNIEDVAEWIKIADDDFDSAFSISVVKKIREFAPILDLINIIADSETR